MSRVAEALGAPDSPIDWCVGHYDMIDGDLAWVGHRGCNCGPERVRRREEAEAKAEAFIARIAVLSGSEAKWALRRLVEDTGHGLDEKCLDHALALVESGGIWHDLPDYAMACKNVTE